MVNGSSCKFKLDLQDNWVDTPSSLFSIRQEERQQYLLWLDLLMEFLGPL
jgi:hypothetical protein